MSKNKYILPDCYNRYTILVNILNRLGSEEYIKFLKGGVIDGCTYTRSLSVDSISSVDAINSTLTFETEDDMMMFILKWS